jgi:hypothetical protein
LPHSLADQQQRAERAPHRPGLASALLRLQA